MTLCAGHVFGESTEWVTLGNPTPYKVVAYESITFSLNHEGEELGSITLVDKEGLSYIETLQAFSEYRLGVVKENLIRYVMEHYKGVLVMAPSSLEDIQVLANLGFEPMYIEDWGSDAVHAPWDKGYRGMIYIPVPSPEEALASFHKRFLMALSEFVDDICEYEPTRVEGPTSVSLSWRNGEVMVMVMAHLNGNMKVFAAWDRASKDDMCEVSVETYQDILKLGAWFSQADSVAPCI